jgi:[ribosomal protein S18]-alanine N-acetyltransferase
MKIRIARESDLPQLISLSDSAGEAAHWTRQQWLDIFHSQTPSRLAWIAEAERGAGGQAAGFLVAQTGAPEWELENIAVLPEYRRQGVARALLSALLAQARSLLAERILLEVRASNEAAIRLYHASGFQTLARRRDYYRNPSEDAIILAHPLPH